MRRLLRWLPCLCLLGFAPVQAHEFWFTPVPNPATVHGHAKLELQVGEYFEGDLAGFSAQGANAFTRHTTMGHEDLMPLLPQAAPVGELQLPLRTAGTHLLVFDSQPRRLELSADKFHAYLHDEGLDFIKALREEAGTADTPGRERFRRHVKTLIQVGPQARSNSPADTTFAMRTGQRLEVMPLNNPLTMAVGSALGIQVLLEGQPLAGALVKAWHKHAGQTLLIRSTTSSAGKVTFKLPYRGAWMVSVVHMLPANDTPEVDWDSLWGNLSFSLR